jgi:alpha-beta hydrolase superfamily lysophospholipase
MLVWMVWFSLKVMQWALCFVGAVVLLIIAMVATPIRQPPELVSISKTARAVDRSTMPGLARFHARDGTELAYRHYPPRGQATGQIAIVVHGSSGSSAAIHALSDGIATRGVDTYAPDIRGHGGSGTRGDVAYLGQLEDDMVDFVAEIRKSNPDAPITLLGHSAGGGFALRVAGSPIQNLFVRTVLLAPYLGYDAPSSRRDSGGWANPDIPRFLGLSMLRLLGIDCCEQLPTLAFAVPKDSSAILAPVYSYRLMLNFAANRNFRGDLEAASKPMAVFAAAQDELMIVNKYKEAVGDRVPVHLIDGVNHMAIVSDPKAVAAIADDVVTHGVTGS